MAKRLKLSADGIDTLPSNLLESIFLNLPFKDFLRIQSVSKNWFSISKALMEFKLSRRSFSNQVPCLLLNHCSSYVDINNKKVLQNIHNNNTDDNCCIGSSHGWLILLHHTGSVFIQNPFLQIKLDLPCIYSLMDILKIEKSSDIDEYRIQYKKPTKSSFFSLSSEYHYTKNFRDGFIYKAILSSDPCLDVHNLKIFIIYEYQHKIGYCCLEDKDGWRELGGGFYHDILFSDNTLYALGSQGHIEAWDTSNDVPVKKTEIKLSFPSYRMYQDDDDDSEDLYVMRFYLVENLGDLLLVVRHIGEFVNEDHEAVHEGDLLTDEDTHPLVCPYKTLSFRVYKMDLEDKRWVELQNLGDRALFVGGNQSVSVSIGEDSGCKKNSIYYTDDYWMRMDEDYLYGGHDCGVFTLEDQKIEEIYETDSMKIQPPPCWISPSLVE